MPWQNGVSSRRKWTQVENLGLLEPPASGLRLGKPCRHFCAGLRWLALTLVEIKFAGKSKQVFHRLASQPKSTQIQWRSSCNLLLANEIGDSLPWNVFSCDLFLLWLACACEVTSKSIYGSLYASSTCDYLPGLFDQGCNISRPVRDVISQWNSLARKFIIYVVVIDTFTYIFHVSLLPKFICDKTTAKKSWSFSKIVFCTSKQLFATHFLRATCIPPPPPTISEIFGLTRLSDYCNSFIKMDKNYLMKELLPRSPLITQLIGQVICCFLYKPMKHFCYLMPGAKNIKESWDNSALNREI